MSAQNDGGPAFPIQPGSSLLYAGMALRDYFAAAALQGMLAKQNINVTNEKLACYAYGAADAMLAEREKGKR